MQGVDGLREGDSEDSRLAMKEASPAISRTALLGKRPQNWSSAEYSCAHGDT
jgi:hypothetical protein